VLLPREDNQTGAAIAALLYFRPVRRFEHQPDEGGD
jgi:hypothetical protein